MVLKAGGLVVGEKKKKKKVVEGFSTADTMQSIDESRVADDWAHKFIGETLQKQDDPFGRTFQQQKAGQDFVNAQEDKSGGGGPGETPTDPNQLFRDAQGNIVGIGDKFGFSQEEAAAFIARQQRKQATPEGFIEAGDLSALRRRQAALGNLGEIDTSLQQGLTEGQTNYSQALFAGAVGNLPSALKTGAAIGGAALLGAKTGALTGAAGGPLGIAAGAGIGIAIGIFGGVLKNIETQKKGEINAADEVLTLAKTNLRQLAMLATQDPANADTYISAFNEQLSLVHQARRQIFIETQGDSNAYIEDGRDILSGFDLFLDPNTGTASIYEQKLRVALNSDQVVALTEQDLPE